MSASEPSSARIASNYQTVPHRSPDPDSYPSSFLSAVSLSCLRRPALLVCAGVDVDWLVLERQLALRASCRTDRSSRCAAGYASRSAAWPRGLAPQRGQRPPRQNPLHICPPVAGCFVLWIPGGRIG